MADSIELIEQYLEENYQKDDNNHDRLSDIAYEWLKEAILVLDVRSGDPVSENRLSQAFGISRTPVRTAIEKLAQENLLQVIPGRAVVIASRSVNEVFDAMDVRILLEPELCRQTAGSISQENRERLEELTKLLEIAAQDNDRPAWVKADIEWHTLICEACPNELLGKMVLQAFTHMRLQGVVSHIPNKALIPGTEEHRTIADIIIAGKGDLAKEMTRSHLEAARKRLFKPR
jgi:DNA-binding GntR family transcriptional regulator